MIFIPILVGSHDMIIALIKLGVGTRLTNGAVEAIKVNFHAAITRQSDTAARL